MTGVGGIGGDGDAGIGGGGGGGGGSGATGGHGGNGGANPGSGGAAGSSGAGGVGNQGGGGGGGGVHGAVVTVDTTNTVTVNGGAGGNGGNASWGGGGGGAAGYGVVVNGAGINYINFGLVSGGNGGGGGQSQTSGGGSGGSGGSGIAFAGTGGTFSNFGILRGGAGGAGGNGGSAFGFGRLAGFGATGGAAFVGSGMTIINSGTITGGIGGGTVGLAPGRGGIAISGNNLAISNAGAIVGGSGGHGGRNSTTGAFVYGSGAEAVVGSGLSISNGGIIAGGLSGDGQTRTNAINFTGGSNSLTFQTGSAILGNIVIGGAGTLTLSETTAQALAGAITGNGSLVHDGTSTLTLSGTSTYSGATLVNAGTLLITGALNGTSAVTVINGATFGGTGSVNRTTVQNGGTLMPGAPGTPGTFTITGNLVFSNGATYLVQGQSNSAYSKTNVTGSANVTGTAKVTFADGAYLSGTYTIIAANGGVTGTFANLITSGNVTGIRNPHLAYDANNVFLVLDPGLIAISPGFSGNQQNVANAINNAIMGGTVPNEGFATLLGFTGTQLTDSLTQLAGMTPGGAPIAGMQLMNGFLSVMLHPTGGPPSNQPDASGASTGFATEADFPREIAEAYAAAVPVKAELATTFTSRWSVWAAGYGGSTHRSSQADIGTASTNARAYGIAAGAEYKFDSQTTLGFALAGGGTSWGLANGLGNGGGNAFQIGGYASHTFGPAYISGALAYSWHDMRTDRAVTAVGSERLHASFHAQGFGARLEGGYRLRTPWLGITPYGALQLQTFHTPSYGEVAQSGAGAFALSYEARNITATRIELGAWVDKPLALASGQMLLARGRLAWGHDHSNDPTINPFFQTLPGSNFTVNTTMGPSDLALLTAGAELRLANNWAIAAQFDGEFSSHSQTYAGTGVIKRVW
ncbi:autotransporter domain-containing protein [Pseudolabrys taiwanensis]|uniref:Autotransporter domain-containing protein n=1 Tax=Pseudolabrys taiwanensis TaxID=331696 RepID=A0A345ZQ85_9HYPH|nr:autotransporter domain-containing protein [Pseudolabrys taiwanensis]